jgi:hypothetical protein
MTAVACVYAGFGLIAAGLFGLVRPSGGLRRPRAGLIALTGLVAVALGLRMPAPEARAVPARTGSPSSSPSTNSASFTRRA